MKKYFLVGLMVGVLTIPVNRPEEKNGGAVLGFIGGVIGGHYGGKLLDAIDNRFTLTPKPVPMPGRELPGGGVSGGGRFGRDL